MAPGWSADEEIALMGAWARTHGNSGTNDDLYRHFVELCELEPPKTNNAVISRKQTLANVCHVIATFASLKRESGQPSGVNSDGGNRDRARLWFQLGPDERRSTFDRLNTSSYTFVDVDEDTLWKVQRYTTGVQLVRTIPKHDWDRDELLALLQAHEHVRNESPRRRQFSVEALTYRRFVSLCAGDAKRSPQTVMTKLETIKNMVSIVNEYDRASEEGCASCFVKNRWFVLSPAERKARFDERNSLPHRFMDLDEPLFRAANRTLNQENAEPPRSCEQQSRDGDDDTVPAAATVSSAQSCIEESKESETTDARTEEQEAVRQEAIQTVRVLVCEPPVLEVPNREPPARQAAICPHLSGHQETTVDWQTAHKSALAATELALTELKTKMQEQHQENEERERKRKRLSECQEEMSARQTAHDSALAATKIELAQLKAEILLLRQENEERKHESEAMRSQLAEERTARSAVLGSLCERLESEAMKRKQLADQVRELVEYQRIYRQAEREWHHTALSLDGIRDAAESPTETTSAQEPQ